MLLNWHHLLVSKFGGTRIATEIILFFLNLSPNCHKNFSVKNIMFDTVFQCQILKIEKKKKGFLSILCATEKFWVACAAHLLAAHVVCHVVLKACGQPSHHASGATSSPTQPCCQSLADDPLRLSPAPLHVHLLPPNCHWTQLDVNSVTEKLKFHDKRVFAMTKGGLSPSEINQTNAVLIR